MSDPSNRIFLICELDPENHQIPALLGLEHYSIVAKKAAFSSEDYINKLSLFHQPKWMDSNIILTGNAGSVQNLRKALKKRGVSRKIHAKGFWLEGKKGL